MQFEILEKSELDGIKLILLYPNKIPPHIIVVSDNIYFDLRYNKAQSGNYLQLSEHIDKKKIPTLTIHTNLKINTQLFSKHFDSYSSLNKNTTCLSPIKDYLAWTGIKTIFDFLDQLRVNHHTTEYTLSNLQHYGTFMMNTYTEKEIKTYIQRLKNCD